MNQSRLYEKVAQSLKSKFFLFDEIKEPDDIKLFEQFDTQIGKLKIHWAQAGPPDGEASKGKTIILIHGWTNNWQGWIPVAKLLTDHYRVVMVDLPGYGDSLAPKPEYTAVAPAPLYNLVRIYKLNAKYNTSHYTLEKQADWLADFCHHERIKPIAVIGMSMGTFVASVFAQRHPDLAKSVILIGPVLKTSHSPRLAQAFQKTLELVNGHQFGENLVKQLVSRRLYAYLVAKYINMYRFNRFLIDAYGLIGKQKMTKEAFIQMGISAGKCSIEDTLAGIKSPLLLIWGKADKLTNPQIGQAILKNKGIKFDQVVIPQAGHIVNLEKPKAVAEAIKKFLSLRE